MQHKEDAKRIEVSKGAFGHESQSSDYAVYRPSYPAEFFTEEIGPTMKALRNSLNDDEPLVALDLGCGSGQATFQISQYFDKTIGIDINSKQLEMALEKGAQHKGTSKVTFVAGDCAKVEEVWREKLQGQNVHAIFCCQAFHWFNHDDILEQCKRILKPTGGYLFLLGYPMFRLLPASQKYQKLFDSFYSQIYGFFDFDRDVLNNSYTQIDFKKYFDDVRFVRRDQDQHNCPPGKIIGYLNTFSAYRSKLERADKSPEEDSLKLLVEGLGYKNYVRGKVEQIDYTTGPETISLSTPFFMYIMK